MPYMEHGGKIPSGPNLWGYQQYIHTPLLKSEEVAIDEWLLSNKVFHSIRDHPQHGDWQILTGLPSQWF